MTATAATQPVRATTAHRSYAGRLLRRSSPPRRCLQPPASVVRAGSTATDSSPGEESVCGAAARRVSAAKRPQPSVRRRTAWRLLLALGALLACLLPSVASAHPLGNFTVNHYSRIEPAGDRVRISYVLDMAEIPTFQEQPRIQPDPQAYADARAEELRQNLHLSLDGQATPLHLEQRSLSLPAGAGGLPTLRLEAVYSAELHADPGATVSLSYRDDNDPQRIGWREIVARPGAAGTTLESSSVPANDVTDALRTYPEDLLNSPLNVREAEVRFVPGAAAARPLLAASGIGVVDRTRSLLAELANGAELTPAFILFALGVATVLGAAHALQPGHGKTVVAAYLVGSRGTARHALFLGATVTATHTAGVYALGLVTLGLSQYILPERLYPILETVSGLLVVGIGAFLFGSRLLSALRHRHESDASGVHRHGPFGRPHTHLLSGTPAEHDHAQPPEHAHDHAHAQPHGHDHAEARPHALAVASVPSTHAHIATAQPVELSAPHRHGDHSPHTHEHGHAHSLTTSVSAADSRGASARHGEAPVPHSDDRTHPHLLAVAPAGASAEARGVGALDTVEHDHADGATAHRHWPFGRPHTHAPHATTEPQPAEPPRARVSWRSLLALGVSGGLLPCPEALMVLLITIAAHRVLFGLLLIVAFSTGLAGVLVGFGLLLVYARGLFGRITLSRGLLPRVLPVASAFVIVLAGLVITAQALPQVV